MVNQVTWYPGVGADEEIARLERLVGKITAHWAEIEDTLFIMFVFALSGHFAFENIAPYRAVFFTFSSYEGKMRMLHNAMKERFRNDPQTLSEWAALRTSLNELAALRNEIAHLIPRPKYTLNPNDKAIVRLAPPFFRPRGQDDLEFERAGYSWDELTRALAPFWGYDPSLNINDASHTRLIKRLDSLHIRLQALSPQARPSSPERDHGSSPADPTGPHSPE